MSRPPVAVCQYRCCHHCSYSSYTPDCLQLHSQHNAKWVSWQQYPPYDPRWWPPPSWQKLARLGPCKIWTSYITYQWLHAFCGCMIFSKILISANSTQEHCSHEVIRHIRTYHTHQRYDLLHTHPASLIGHPAHCKNDPFMDKYFLDSKHIHINKLDMLIHKQHILTRTRLSVGETRLVCRETD